MEMQKYDWLRLLSEVRPTFLPYAHFKVKTHLSPEECRSRLAAVMQPQKMPLLLLSRPSDDPRLVFKGQISEKGFLAFPLGSRPIAAKSRTTRPFLLFARFSPALDGASIAVSVMPDVYTFLLTGALLALVSQPIIQGLSLHDTWMQPFLLARLLFWYSILALPVSFEAYRIKKTLQRLFGQPIRA